MSDGIRIQESEFSGQKLEGRQKVAEESMQMKTSDDFCLQATFFNLLLVFHNSNGGIICDLLPPWLCV
jgi:hypothetical protein